MSLLRQLLLSVTVAIVAILVGTLVFSVNGARDYLNAQLQAESDNAATSLALSLSQPSNQDPVLRELLVTALFDSGQFQAIELHDTQGRELVSRRVQQGTGQASAPDWFSRMLPLRAPSATRHVTDGWTQVGELTVVADDSQARLSLWDSSTRVLIWVILAGVLWLVFVAALMRWLKRALHDEITRQVESIADGQAVAPQQTHRTVADLLPASHVITGARERVQASKQEAAQRIESLTLELNHDAVTGLPNRRYFMNELRRALQGRDDNGDAVRGGHVLLCRQRDLGEMAAMMSRDELDSWLRRAGERLQQALTGFTDVVLHTGRLNGSDFAVLISGAEGPQAMLIAQAVRQALLETRITVAPGRNCRWAFAMTDFAGQDELSVIFSRLDTALMAAESAGHTDIETLLSAQFGDGASYGISGEAAWRSLLTNALSESSLDLSVQPVNYGTAQADQGRHESTLMITDPARAGGESLSGFSFMPAAVRLGLSAELDARAIQLALAWLARHTGELVVRVSVPSLLRAEFLSSLREALDSIDRAGHGSGTDGVSAGAPLSERSTLQRLIVELDAYGVSAYPAEVSELCQMVRGKGVRVGVRGVAQQVDVIARLHGLPVAYIKLGGGFIADLETSQGAVRLLEAVTQTAAALQVQVLIDDTPGEATARLLRDHGALLRSD